MILHESCIGSTQLRVTNLGFGTGVLGNLYSRIDDEDARSAVDAAFDIGIRFFDTAPFYGFGLSERRLGEALQGRRGAIVSSKVGRLLVPDESADEAEGRDGFYSPMPFRAEFDYSYDAVLRSHEASLHRLGLARIDQLFVHDIGMMTHGAKHDLYWHQLTKGGGFRALEQLRDEGAISGFGLGVNETAICLEAMREANLDVILLAGRYTLLEQTALKTLLPACADANVSVVIGGPYNSGILATGTRTATGQYYNYAQAPVAIVERVRRIEEIAEAHKIPLAAAALQFPLAHPAVASVIPGLNSADQVMETQRLFGTAIPNAFWSDLRDAGLIRSDAPVPGRKTRHMAAAQSQSTEVN